MSAASSASHVPDFVAWAQRLADGWPPGPLGGRATVSQSKSLGSATLQLCTDERQGTAWCWSQGAYLAEVLSADTDEPLAVLRGTRAAESWELLLLPFIDALRAAPASGPAPEST